jgi:hypothetical protein
MKMALDQTGVEPEARHLVETARNLVPEMMAATLLSVAVVRPPVLVLLENEPRLSGLLLLLDRTWT